MTTKIFQARTISAAERSQFLALLGLKDQELVVLRAAQPSG